MDNKIAKRNKQFKEHFNNLKEKRIIIYGLGIRTLGLLPDVEDYNVVGLMDRSEDNTGRIIGGKRVLSIEEANRVGDIVVINSDPANYETIYRRIKDTISIPVYYGDGRKATIQEEAQDNFWYWNCSYDNLVELIDSHDIILFDVFDTLIMRRVMSPSDVHEIVQRNLTDKGINVGNYTFNWSKASSVEQNTELRLKDIINNLKEIGGYSEEICKKILEEEIIVEKAVCISRTKMKEAYEYAKKKKKKIYFVSDMYFSKQDIRELLCRCEYDLDKDTSIWVSSEKNASKMNGKMWEMLMSHIKSTYGEASVLHIGDNQYADIDIPRRYGIDTYKILSAKELLEHSSISALDCASSIEESMLLGQVVSVLFNNPFGIGKTKGIVSLHDPKQYGYCVYGGVLFLFFKRIYELLQMGKGEEAWFFARDGWFLKHDFDLFQKKYGKEVFKTRYLPASRRMLGVASIKNEKDVLEISKAPYNGTFAQYMKSRFGVEVDERTVDINEVDMSELSVKDHLQECVLAYKNEILEESGNERDNYTEYLVENEGLSILEKKAIVVDLGLYGSCQYYFQHITNKKYYGCYLMAYMDNDNKFLKECDFEGVFNCGHLDGQLGYYGKKNMFMEAFLTAPYGMMRRVNDEMEIECEEDGLSQNNFFLRELMNEGTIQYIEYWTKITNMDYKTTDFTDFASKMYYTILDKSEMGDEILEGLYFDNPIIGSVEQKMSND